MARVVSHGPDGRMLNATFREADKLEYQDSLGRLTLEVAQAVPDGVLLFLPSYSLMDKLRERWKVGLGLEVWWVEGAGWGWGVVDHHLSQIA
jgi:Fanconi anemia group J protein